MTERECKWWSNLYREMTPTPCCNHSGIHTDQVRMLASPLRQCFITEKQLPPVRIQFYHDSSGVSDTGASRTVEILLLEHSGFLKFTLRHALR